MTSSSTALLQHLLARVEKLEADLAARDARISALEADNAELKAENAQRKKDNAQLRRRLGLDSTTSSQPPWADKPWKKKPAPCSLRTRSGRKPGKQPGDPGTTLSQVSDPDQVIDHHPSTCAGCAQPLTRARHAGLRRGQGRAALNDEERDDIGHRYARVIAFAKAGPTHPLIRRLDARREDYLRFATDFGVPFTSNAAERDLRMVKPQVKVSGGWRTLAGAERFCRIRSFVSTLKKQGLTVLDKLTDLFAGNAWIPSTT